MRVAMSSVHPSRVHPRLASVTSMAAVLGHAALLGACEKEQKAAEPVIRPVKYQVAEPSGGMRTYMFSGESSASLESTLSFKVPGTVSNLAVKVGDTVAKSQLIAELSTSDYQLQVQQATATLASAKAQERNAKASYERVEKMYETESASRSDLDAARAGYLTAQANVSAAAKQVELARLQVSYTRLTAPVAGTIASVPVERNENVSAGQPVAVLTSGDKLKVTVAVADKYISEVRSGQEVQVTFPDLAGKTFAAVVSEIAPTSSGAGAAVTVLLSESSAEIRPGLPADVQFTFGSQDDKERFVLPPSAVGEDREGHYVYLVEDKDKGLGVVRRKSVAINPEPTVDGIEVLDGVKAGDKIVTAGLARITDGLTVKVPVPVADQVPAKSEAPAPAKTDAPAPAKTEVAPTP